TPSDSSRSWKRSSPPRRTEEVTMYARIGTFDVPPATIDAVTTYFHDEAVPAFSRHEGFLGYQAYVDRAKGRIVGISFWTTREALEASSTTARPLLAHAATLGAVLTGEPQILEQAFDAPPVPVRN